MEIIIATGNAGKVREFKRMLEPFGFTVYSQKEKGIVSNPEETGDTFAENALIKARAVWEQARTAVIADDSGLCVDALDGRPGVYSARYAGEDATDADRNRKLLSELEGVKNRSAHFTCAIAYIDAAEKSGSSRASARGKSALRRRAPTDSATTRSFSAGTRPSGR